MSPKDHHDGWHVLALAGEGDFFPIPKGFAPATLQHYWRADITRMPEELTAGTALPLRDDATMLAAGEWFHETGHPWNEETSDAKDRFHITHLPDRTRDGAPTWKVATLHKDDLALAGQDAARSRNSFSALTARRCLAGRSTIIDKSTKRVSILGDGRALFDGAVLFGFSIPDEFRSSGPIDAEYTINADPYYFVDSRTIKEQEVQKDGRDTDPQPAPIPRLSASFRNTSFSGGASFSSTAFSSFADFQNTAFSGGADFQNTVFSGYANFQNTTFSGYANFYGTAFSGYAIFQNTAFSGTAFFQNTAFSDFADFSNTAFSDEADFQNTAFLVTAYFQNSAFSGLADFSNAAFFGKVFFPNTTFSGDAFFVNTAFCSNATFHNAIFESNTYFRQCLFMAGAIFSAALELAPETDLMKGRSDFPKYPPEACLVFAGPVDFSNASFWDEVTFENRTFRAATNFSGARFYGRPKFHNTTLHDDTDFSVPSFEPAPGDVPPTEDFKWLERLKPGDQTPAGQKAIRREIYRKARHFAKEAFENKVRQIATYNTQRRNQDPEFETVAKNFERDFRRLKLLMGKAEARNEEQAFFALELKARRLRLPPVAIWLEYIPYTALNRGYEKGSVSRLERWGSWIYEKVSDYGRSLFAPLVALLVTGLVFGGLYAGLGWITPPLAPRAAQAHLEMKIGGKTDRLFLTLEERNNRDLAMLHDPAIDLDQWEPRLLDPAARARYLNTYPGLSPEPLIWKEAFILAAARTLVPVGRQEGRFEWWDRTVELAPGLTFAAGALHRLIAILLIFLFALTVRRRFQIS